MSGLKLEWVEWKSYPDGSACFRAEVGDVGCVRVRQEKDGQWRASTHVGPYGTFARFSLPTKDLAQKRAEELGATAVKRLKRKVDEAARVFAPKKKGGAR